MRWILAANIKSKQPAAESLSSPKLLFCRKDTSRGICLQSQKRAKISTIETWEWIIDRLKEINPSRGGSSQSFESVGFGLFGFGLFIPTRSEKEKEKLFIPQLNPSQKLNSCGKAKKTCASLPFSPQSCCFYTEMVTKTRKKGNSVADNKGSSRWYEFLLKSSVQPVWLCHRFSPFFLLISSVVRKLLRKWNGFFMTELYWHISLSHHNLRPLHHVRMKRTETFSSCSWHAIDEHSDSVVKARQRYTRRHGGMKRRKKNNFLLVA